MADPLTDELRQIVGASHVISDVDAAAGFTVDWTGQFRGDARCVVRPKDTAEVAGVVTACAAAGAAMVPQGGNTGLVGGGVPRGGEVVVSLTRLDTLEAVDVEAATVVVGAGATLASVQRHAASSGFAFGVDLAARDTATVGGMIATNAGGMHVLRHGAMRAQLRGVEAVLADGTVLSRLTGLVKDNVGYDLTGLLAGSEGTLGLVTRACLRLIPATAYRVAALLAVESVEAAVTLAGRLARQLPELEAAELVLGDALDLACSHANLRAPFQPTPAAVLLIECAGPADPTERLADAVGEAPEVLEAAVADDRPGRAELWAYRERLLEAIDAEGAPVKLDVSLPTGALPDFVAGLRSTLAAADAQCWPVLFGHIGDGNLHVNVLAASRHEAIIDAVLRRVISDGGSISAEHGVGVMKAPWVTAARGEADVAAMRSIKHALDPRGMLNPGVLFPSAADG